MNQPQLNKGSRCVQCGAELPENCSGGVCTSCLKTAGLDEETQVDTGEEASTGAGSSGSEARCAPALDRVRYFGDYEILEEIARGGMGVVYKARQASLNRTVALKMILAGELARAEDVQRFRTEAEAAANLQHPSIVAIHEVGEHGGQHYFSMDYIEGQNLAELVKDGPLPPRRAAELLKAIAEAIHYAHQRGTLHRDIKPHNVLIDTAGKPHVTDFGLAKRIERDSGLTQTGAVMGSPAYMPPEQASGKHDLVGPQSDVYSLGATLYKLLTGQTPFGGDSSMATLQKVMQENPAPPSKLNPSVPKDLETVCLKCLEKKPERRYGSARDLAEELGRFLDHEPILAKPANPVRKSWMWLARHPWAITGLFSLVMLVLLALAYGLWEEASMWRWKTTHPQAKARFNALTDIFSESYITTVCVLFLVQSLPISAFNRAAAKRRIFKFELWGYRLAGAGLVLSGLWVGRLGLRLEIWMNRFGASVFLWGLSSLSNVWFGTLLIWKSVQQGREADFSKTVSTKPTRPQFATRRQMLGILFSEYLLVLAAMLVFSKKAGAELSGISILLWLLAVCWTITLLLGGYIARSSGTDRTVYLPLFLPSLFFSLVGALVAFIPSDAQIPGAVAALAGLAGGWIALTSRVARK